MAPSHTTGNSCQTIDLTGSSPEPEEMPQQRPQQRPQPRPPQRLVQMYLKPEPRAYGMANVGMEARHPLASARNPVGPQQARPIHPEHIKQIIETADPRAVQKLLLELCQMSPAFSGALVRGLAPHSASAQGLISQQRMQSHQPKVKIQDEDDSDELYEAAKRNLVKPTVPTPSHNSLPAQFRDISGSRPTSRPHGSEFASRVKREPRERSQSSSDGDMHLPGAYPRSTTLRTPVRKPSGPSSSVNQTPRLLTRDTPRSASINKRPAPLTKTCTVCHEQIVDVNAPCVFHSGERHGPEGGSIKWDCCNEDLDHPGCEFFGQHTTGEELEEDAMAQKKRPSASPGPSRATQKRPRAF